MNSCATVWRGRGQRSGAKEGIYTTYNIEDDDEIDNELLEEIMNWIIIKTKASLAGVMHE